MALTKSQLEKKVATILSEVKDNVVSDGLDILAASLAAAIVSANATGLFDKVDLHPYMVNLEERIDKTLKVLDVPHRNNFKMKRAN